MKSQKGAVIPLLAVALVVLIGIGALVVDVGQVYARKSELQNVLDASALSAAKVLMSTQSTDQALAAAQSTFTMDLPAGLANRGLTPVVEFSDTLDPFVAGGTTPHFVRVGVTGMQLATWFARVLPGGPTAMGLRGSAVAGPEPLDHVCKDLTPLLVCAKDPNDTNNFGFQPGAQVEERLAQSSQDDTTVGTGNFQLLALGCNGGDCLRNNLDAGYNGGCVGVGDTITTETGMNVGPVFQGLNTRFGIYQGTGGGKPDTVTHYAEDASGNNTFWYSSTNTAEDTYTGREDAGNLDYVPPDGIFGRRIIRVVVGVCDATQNGKGQVQVAGVGCFFLTRPAGHSGHRTVNGQFLGRCESSGSASATVTNDWQSQPYKIVLFKDPDSRDS